MLAVSLLLVLLVYGAGLLRVWRSAGYGRGIRVVEAGAFSLAWITIAIALSPPFDELSDAWLVAHMLQWPLSYVEERWSPSLVRCYGKLQTKANANCQRAFPARSAEGLSLSGGASIRSRACSS